VNNPHGIASTMKEVVRMKGEFRQFFAGLKTRLSEEELVTFWSLGKRGGRPIAIKTKN